MGVFCQGVCQCEGKPLIVRGGLPAYAPEQNPVEYIRGCMKNRELANPCAHTIGEVAQFACNRLKSISGEPD